MKKLAITLSIVALSFQTADAQWWKGSKEIDGNGKMTTQTRTVPKYDQVNLIGSMDVEFVRGKEGNLKLEAEENLMEYIVTEVDGNSLKITVEKGFSLSPSRNKGIKVTVPIETLEGVSLTGSGDIYSSDEIRAEKFEIKLTGSGDIRLPLVAKDASATITGSGDISLRGSASDFNCKVIGSGDISAFDFRCETVDATVIGSGDLEVYASEALRAKIPGSGDIQYKGNPKNEDFKTMGSGDITKR
ncbi:head GIN domain-containing protein [Salinimicrobium flavum]|uniref:Head GIN domain-containing protein n=1 Tax=Salinimicrobium flavum TaxID=1737065 RepID=A0ABW5J103_9FLAO